MLHKKDHKVYLAICADADTPDSSVDTNKVAILTIRGFELRKEAISQFYANKRDKVD